MSAILLQLPGARPARRIRRRGRPDGAHDQGATTPVDLAAYRQVQGGRAPPSWARRAHEVVDAVEQLLADDRAADVVAFCEYAADCLQRNASCIHDDGPLQGLAARIGELRRAAAVRAPGPGGP